MVWHFYGKTKTAIISSKNQFRPQFRAQIVAGVETHPYSPFLGPGDHFWQSYEENHVQKIFSRDLPYDFEKKRNRHLYQDFPFCQTNSTITSVWWLELSRWCEGRDLVDLHRGEPKSRPSQWGIVRHRRYPTVRLGALLNWNIYIVNRQARRFFFI